MVEYRISFADQGNQASVSVSVFSKQLEACRFHFPFVANKRKLPFSVCGTLETWRWRTENGDMGMETSNRKQKTEPQAIFSIRLLIWQNGSFLFVRLLMKKQTQVNRLQRN
jgi:hypothetical protein